MTRRSLIFATIAANATLATVALAAPPPVAIPGCVSELKDVHTGSGAKAYASHYVTSGAYGYGEFLAGSFGGQSLWQRRGTLWCRIETGTTALDRAGIAAAGVPPAVAVTLVAKMRATPELAPPAAKPTAHHR
jgi:hypothetical protein